MRSNFLILVLCLFVFGANGQTVTTTDKSDKFIFTDIKTNQVTSVKDQYRSGTCWSFAGIGQIEAELLSQDKGEYDLSEMWIVRQIYFEKAVKYARMHGLTNLSGGGALGDVMYIVDKYGIVPDEVYPGLKYGTKKHIHAELDEAIAKYMEAIVKNPNKSLSTAWQVGFNGILDSYLGVVPTTFKYKGKEYTPQSFAKELGIKNSDFARITSFTHHPFNSYFALEVPDNWNWEHSYNITLPELEMAVDKAIESGHTVNWAADVSEKGFQTTKGFAIVPAATFEELSGLEQAKWTTDDLTRMSANPTGPMPQKVITQQMRQEAFDNYETTDNHAMLIVGIAKDQDGNKFYKVKNSWGDSGIYSGYIYISAPFFRYKTISAMIPVEIIKKK